MIKKPEILSVKELDDFCHNIGLCHNLGLDSTDWDEGGGYTPEAVVRVVKQVQQEVVREVKGLFPEHIRPRHLECWAEQFTRDWGYSSELTKFLKSVAEKWRVFESKYTGGQKK